MKRAARIAVLVVLLAVFAYSFQRPQHFSFTLVLKNLPELGPHKVRMVLSYFPTVHIPFVTATFNPMSGWDWTYHYERSFEAQSDPSTGEVTFSVPQFAPLSWGRDRVTDILFLYAGEASQDPGSDPEDHPLKFGFQLGPSPEPGFKYVNPTTLEASQLYWQAGSGNTPDIDEDRRGVVPAEHVRFIVDHQPVLVSGFRMPQQVTVAPGSVSEEDFEVEVVPHVWANRPPGRPTGPTEVLVLNKEMKGSLYVDRPLRLFRPADWKALSRLAHTWTPPVTATPDPASRKVRIHRGAANSERTFLAIGTPGAPDGLMAVGVVEVVPAPPSP